MGHLATSEVTSVYQNGSTNVLPNSLISHWPLNEGLGSTVYDLQGGYNGTFKEQCGQVPVLKKT